MQFEDTKVYNIMSAIHGMRNALSSWDKSDSVLLNYWDDQESVGTFGENDLKLAQKLIKAGSEQRKFLRQILVSVDITASQFFWSQFDTYKVGITRNSTSFMHRAMDKEFTFDDFDIDFENTCDIESIIKILNNNQKMYKETHDIYFFRAMRQLLPQSYKYMSTVTMNYENIYNMIKQRQHHRLKEWSEDFIDWAKSLPFSKELLFI